MDSELDSIFEQPRVSTSLVLLYVGALIAALGPAVLVGAAWSAVSDLGRLLICALPVAGLSAVAERLWRRSDFRTALPCFLGVVLATPALAFSLLHLVPAFASVSHASDDDAELQELVLDPAPLVEDPIEYVTDERGGSLRLDLKIALTLSVSLLATLAAWRRTRSPVWAWFTVVLSGLACLFHALWLGWRGLDPHRRAEVFLPLCLLTVVVGIAVDRSGRWRDARAFYLLGFAALALTWYMYSAFEYPVAYLSALEYPTYLSLVLGGLLSASAGVLADKCGTPLQRRYATLLYSVSTAAVLFPLSVLVSFELVRYEVLLTVACFTFVALSVFVQRKVLLYAGGSYLSVAAFLITDNHFEAEWRWPVALITIGVLVMMFAYLLPFVQRRFDSRSART